MNIRQAWDFFSFQKKREILVACGVNNRIYLCAQCPASGMLPNCGHENCEPCKTNGTRFPYTVTKEGIVYQVDEPHAAVLANKEFEAMPDWLKKKVTDLLNSI